MKLSTFLSTLTMLALPFSGLAQVPSGPDSGAAGRQPESEVLTRDTLSQSDLKRLSEQIDQWNRVDGNGGVTPRVARSRAAAMLKVLNVSCAISDAAYRGAAPDGGAPHVYEATCEEGMGYLLLLQGNGLTGISCLARGPDELPMKCELPANADPRVMANKVLDRHQVPCKSRELKWLGTSAASLDHIEVVCEAGAAQVIRAPRPGSSGKLEVLSCQDAIKQGVRCELSAQATPAGPADSRPSLAWFKEALNRNGVTCQVKQARIIGRESIKRRYLVEFDCSDRPEGLVAFVPSAGDTVNAFESLNCPAAAERGIRCELISKAVSSP
jgi:hypothetical protein